MNVQCRFAFFTALIYASGAQAQVTTTYRYDALGRVTGTTSSGSVNNGVVTAIGYDAAGNRLNYGVSGAAGFAAAPAMLGENGAAAESGPLAGEPLAPAPSKNSAASTRVRPAQPASGSVAVPSIAATPAQADRSP